MQQHQIQWSTLCISLAPIGLFGLLGLFGFLLKVIIMVIRITIMVIRGVIRGLLAPRLDLYYLPY
jgi:hypothetical protein